MTIKPDRSLERSYMRRVILESPYAGDFDAR